MSDSQEESDRGKYLSAAERRYLNKKTVGGDSSREGLIFEERVAAFELVRLVSEIKSGSLSRDAVEVVLQARSFIDDVAVRVQDTTRWFEAKSGQIGWGALAQEVESPVTAQTTARRRTVRQNFLSQIRFDKDIGRRAEYFLAVTSNDIKATLAGQRKKLGLEMVEVIAVPNETNIVAIEAIHSDFREKLERLCPLSGTDDDLEDVFWAIMSCFRRLQSGVRAPFREIEILSQRSCRHVLSLRKNGDLDTDVRAILESIDGFEFEVCGDVLHYRYDGDHGTARFSLDTSAGTEFERDVRNMDTATFEELIPLLRKNRC